MTTPATLLLIDLQTGAFDGVRCPVIDQPERLLANASALLAAARAAGAPVVHVQHLEDQPGAPFEPGTPQVELHPRVAPQTGEPVVQKRQCNAFADTALAEVLAAAGGGRTLVVAGLQSDFCVRQTTLAALERGDAVLLADDAHGTWPWKGEEAEAIRSRIRGELVAAGAQPVATAAIEGRWPA
jgi:nicotinamidase-related amidase